LRAITFVLSGVCHQFAERCLVFEGQPLPLCARCTGTFVGIVLALLVLRLIEPGRPSGLPARGALAPLGALALLWAVDGANSLLSLVLGVAPLYEPSNALRLVTGAGLGIGLGALLYPIYHVALWRQTDERRVLARGWRLGVLLGAGGALVGLALLWRTAPFWLWLALSSGAVLVSLTVANAALLVLMLRREGRGERWAQAVPYLAFGALMALAEMSAVAGLRGRLLG
jgi:uncharacterized membrane protein